MDQNYSQGDEYDGYIVITYLTISMLWGEGGGVTRRQILSP
jgi:hypothetical protein